ncbi:MAG: hypothetical protein ABJA98_06490 [Acidobacteriota bacterium]
MTTVAPRLSIDEQNPWPGLSAFDETAQRFFNGRREESAALRRLVMQAPLTVLFAASGLGKTSLVQAGLFPLLRKDTLPIYVRLDPRERDTPLIEQAKAALVAEIGKRRVDAPECLGAESLWEYLHRAGLEFWSEDNRLLTPLFVFDQFEEMFTLGASNAAAIARLRTDLADLIENRMPGRLAAGIQENESAGAGLAPDNQRYKVLLSFREDFLAAIEGWKREIPSLLRNRLRLLPMSGEQAFEAVHKTAPHLAPEPIARRIVAFAAAASEVSGENTAELEVAPALLSLVCHGLNERRKEQGKAQFDEALLTGTGQAIVTDFYRNAVAGLVEPVQRFIERELITERGFRKPCDVDDARTLHGVTDRDLALLVDRRVLRIEPARGTERVELTHDLLTRVVREQRDQRRERDKRRRDQRRRLTLAGAALAVIAAVMAGVYVRVNVRVNEQRSLAAAEKNRADEQERQAKVQKGLTDEALKQTARAEEATTKAVTATKEAERATKEAEREGRVALSHQFVGAALNAQGSVIGILFALNALAATRDVDHTVLPDAEAALRQTVDAVHRTAAAKGTALKRPGHTKPITRMVFSPEGNRVATWGADGVRVWNIPDTAGISSVAEEILSLPNCLLLEFSPDGNRLACGPPPFGDFLDLETGKALLPRVGRSNRRGGASNVRQLGFSPDGKLMLWGVDAETNVTDGAAFTRTYPGHRAVFSPDGKLLATIVPKAVKLWDVGSGSELRTWDAEADRLVFSGDGKRLALAGAESVQILDLSSDGNIRVDVNPGKGGCFAFNRDGTRLGVDLPDGFHVVDITRTGSPLTSGTLHSDDVSVLACQFAPDGRSVTFQTWNESGVHVTSMWDLSASRPAVPIRQTQNTPNTGSAVIQDVRSKATTILPGQETRKLEAAAFRPDGTSVVTSGSVGRAWVWDTTSGSRLLTLVAQRQDVLTAAYSPDGTRIATAGLGQFAKLWDAETGRLLHDLDGRMDRILAVAFSPDSVRIAAAGNGNVIVWSTTSGANLTKDGQRDGLSGIGAAFSPDGKRFALFGQRASILDAATFREILPIPGDLGSLGGTAMSRDGQFLAVAQSDGVHLWREGSGWKLLPGSASGQRSAQITLMFSRDGKRLVTPGSANTVRIWDTTLAQEPSTLYCDNQEVKIKGVAFSADEKQIYAAGDNWTLYRFDAPLQDLNAEARRLAIDTKTTLTDEHCGKYLHQQPCPQQLRRNP